MDQRVYYAFAYCTIASALIPLFTALRYRNNATERRLLLLLVGVSLGCDVASIVFQWINISPNYAGKSYRLLEFSILLLLYFHVLERPSLKRAFILFGILYYLFFILNLIFLEQRQINTYVNIASALTFIPLSIYYFYKLMRDLPAARIQELPMFWINVAVLIYFAGNLFLFTLTSYLAHAMRDQMILYWSFHNLLTIGKNILFAVGLSPKRAMKVIVP